VLIVQFKQMDKHPDNLMEQTKAMKTTNYIHKFLLKNCFPLSVIEGIYLNALNTLHNTLSCFFLCKLSSCMKLRSKIL